jgi:hypothetical protein
LDTRPKNEFGRNRQNLVPVMAHDAEEEGNRTEDILEEER